MPKVICNLKCHGVCLIDKNVLTDDLSKSDSVFSSRTLRYCERLMLFISNHLNLMLKEIANFEM